MRIGDEVLLVRRRLGTVEGSQQRRGVDSDQHRWRVRGLQDRAEITRHLCAEPEQEKERGGGLEVDLAARATASMSSWNTTSWKTQATK